MPRRRTTDREAGAHRNLHNALGAEVGDFTPLGSWNPEATRGARSFTYALVKRLVLLRRAQPSLLPCDFVDDVIRSGCRRAFPNIDRWATCKNWLEATATTGAERALTTGSRLIIPNPVGVIPEVTPEIREMIESMSRQPMPESTFTVPSLEDTDMELPMWATPEPAAEGEPSF